MGPLCFLLRFLSVAVAVECAAAALFAHAGRVSPSLDLFAHFAPFYFAGGLVAGMAEIALARRPAVLAAAAIAVVGSAALIAPEYARPAFPSAPAGARPLKLVQFNALRTNARHAEIVDWIVAQDPDVVMMEEVTPALRDRLLQRTGWHVAGRRTTVMIFSPHPLNAVGVRPAAPVRGAPTWVNAVMYGPWGETPLLALHAPWPTSDLEDRVRPIMTQVIRGIGAEKLVMAGDFNSTPWSSGRRRQDADFGLTRVTRGLFSWPTWMGPLAAFPIDHVYAGPRWRLVEISRGPNLGSDHLPIVATLAQAPPRP